MSRRSSSGAVGKLRGGADATSGASAKGVSTALQSVGAEMDKLRAELLSSLTSVVTDTVDMVCEEHEEKFMQAAQAVHQLNGGARGGAGGAGGGGGGGGSSKRSKSSRADANGDTDDGAVPNDYDLFHSCCQRLVSYIDANLATSPDFKQQMDRVILACHSNASEVVLGSVVTKKLWFHTKSRHSTDDDVDEEEQQQEEEEEEGDDDDEVYEVRSKASRGKAPPSRRAPVKAPPPPPARGAKRRVPAPPPPPPPPSRSSKSSKSPVKKRARRESSGRKVNYAPSDQESNDEDHHVEESPRKRKRRATRIHYSDDEDDAQQRDDDDVVFVTNSETNPKQPHYGQADELLQFKDAIGDMCYAERRTPAQTRFFKERLRKAIQFVDAQLCKPSKGKSCGWECAKIRRQMCNRDLPCRNKICRLWHDVEAHTDRCQNTHCEFRIRVMLRETMYKIEHKKLELHGFRSELHTKKKQLLDLKGESVSDRDNFVERRLLENETDQLESEIENAEKDIGIFKATKKTYWATLNEIGLTIDDDDNDGFPQFNGHYVDKKTAAKKKSPAKAARHSDEHATSPTPSAPVARSDRSRRRQSIDTVNLEASPVQKRERISRRSTQQSLKVLTNGVIELDDDDDDNGNEEEETKTDRSADDESSARLPQDEDDEPQANGVRGAREERNEGEKEASEDGVDKSNVRQSADADEDDGENEAQDNDTPSRSASDSGEVEEVQSADYVIGSEETKTQEADSTAEVSMSSALEAFNEVVDAHSEPSATTETDDQKAPEGDEETQATKKTTEEDNAPLLPF